MVDVGKIYDNLYDYESKKRDSYYQVHKRLRFENSEKDILDFIMDKVDFNSGNMILDAGCGTGYTLLRLAAEKKVRGLGISLSMKEINYANEVKIKMNLSDEIRFEVASFDDVLEIAYDRIIAIESLKHSNNLDHTLQNLTRSLKETGILAIADDFVVNNSKSLIEHMKLWQAHGFASLGRLMRIVKQLGNFEINTYDLTDKVPQRPAFKLKLLIQMTRIAGFITLGGLKRNLKTYLGGLLLEMLYRKKKLSYNILIIKKK